jgi:hypothetical protein
MRIGIKKMKIKNFFVLLAIGVCFWFAWERLHKFYHDRFPVASVGECIRFSMDGKTNIKAMVMANDSQYNESFLLEEEGDVVLPMILFYARLRDYNSKRISCDEKVN